jgi:hypothetical protein
MVVLAFSGGGFERPSRRAPSSCTHRDKLTAGGAPADAVNVIPAYRATADGLRPLGERLFAERGSA